MYNILDCDPCILMYYYSNICANTWLYYVNFEQRGLSAHFSSSLTEKIHFLF